MASSPTSISITSSVVPLSSICSLCSAALAAAMAAGLVGIASIRPSCVLSPSLVEVIVSTGVASSDGSVSLFREPTFSSSVLPIVMGEVGDAVAWPWLAASGTSLGGATSSLPSELVSVRLISARAISHCHSLRNVSLPPNLKDIWRVHCAPICSL